MICQLEVHNLFHKSRQIKSHCFAQDTLTRDTNILYVFLFFFIATSCLPRALRGVSVLSQIKPTVISYEIRNCALEPKGLISIDGRTVGAEAHLVAK